MLQTFDATTSTPTELAWRAALRGVGMGLVLAAGVKWGTRQDSDGNPI